MFNYNCWLFVTVKLITIKFIINSFANFIVLIYITQSALLLSVSYELTYLSFSIYRCDVKSTYVICKLSHSIESVFVNHFFFVFSEDLLLVLYWCDYTWTFWREHDTNNTNIVGFFFSDGIRVISAQQIISFYFIYFTLMGRCVVFLRTNYELWKTANTDILLANFQ